MKQGKNLLSILNDLKRDVPTAARELGIREEELTAYIENKEEIPHILVQKAAQMWPVNVRDLYCIEDDAPQGIVIMTQEQSRQSARVLKRGGIDYYEYRDTAMSKTGLFKPEWIKELVTVDDNNPYSKKIFWNNGHFLHQFTYFIGPVNFYYDVNGRRHCTEMNTGDTMYITPYVPHTFATRQNKENKQGLILAVTYGGKISGDTQQELATMAHGINDLVLDYTAPQKAVSALLRMHRENLSLPLKELAGRVGIAYETLRAYERGENEPDEFERYALAEALRISPRDLMPVEDYDDDVVVLRHADARRWEDKGYAFVELASSPKMPHSKGLEVTIERENGDYLKTTLQQYIYNIGEKPVTVTWDYRGDHQQILNQDDSLYVKPCINHSFAGERGKLLVFRIGGRLCGDALHELSLLDKRGLDRIVGECMPWYDKEGKQ